MRLRNVLGGCIGGCALATIGALGLGGAAGASTSITTVPVPGVGQVYVISAAPGIFDCVGVQLNSSPSQPLGACYIDTTNVVGTPVNVIVLQEGGVTTYISLNPPGVSQS